ncbi:hypothetical protein Tco_1459508 [Tanacetum coccineum]
MPQRKYAMEILERAHMLVVILLGLVDTESKLGDGFGYSGLLIRKVYRCLAGSLQYLTSLRLILRMLLKQGIQILRICISTVTGVTLQEHRAVMYCVSVLSAKLICNQFKC